MTQEEIISESVKLFCQLAGGVVVARLAVVWALSRYKAEKVWERRLAAFADLVTALSVMLRINSAWLTEEEERRSSSDDYRAAQGKQYAEAKRKVDEVSAIARLLLPGSTAGILDRMEQELDEYRPDMTFWERLDIDGRALRTALDDLVSDGWRVLKIDRGG